MPSHKHHVGGHIAADMVGRKYHSQFDTGRSGWATTITGKSKPHNNMPPYYVLTYIMKL